MPFITITDSWESFSCMKMLHLYILKFTAHAHNGHNDQILEGSKLICTIMIFFLFGKKCNT